MRISLVTETFFPQINGVSRTLDRLVSYLHDQGDQVQLLTPRYRVTTDRCAASTQVTFPALPLPFYREVLLPLVTRAGVSRELRNFGPDVVHIATEGSLGWAALRAAGKLGLPVVSSYHTNFAQYLDSYRAGALKPLAWRYLRWFHNRTQTTFCPTPSIQLLLAERGFERVGIWGRGVDSERFHPAKRDPELRRQLGFAPDQTVFLYAGRLAAEKNLPMLVAAFLALREQNAGLLLVGDGPLRKQLEKDLGGRGVLVGYHQGEPLARMYAAADVMVFPSLTETFGNVMLEAMASGLPVIGFKVPGPQDVIADGVTGELVEEISATALAAVMQRWLADGAGVPAFARRARSAAELLTWAQINAPVRQAYQQVAGKGRPTSRSAAAALSANQEV